MKKLLVIKEGQHTDAEMYIKGIKKEANKRNILVFVIDIEKTMLDIVEAAMKRVQGVIIANPVREETGKILWRMMISYANKDLDNYTGFSIYKNCTLEAVLQIIQRDRINISGKKVVMLGRNLGGIIGQEMTNRNATVTTCHSKTLDLAEETKRADIVISCVGKKILTPDMIQKHTVVFDVGGDTVGDFNILYGYGEIGQKNIENIFEHMEA